MICCLLLSSVWQCFQSITWYKALLFRYVTWRPVMELHTKNNNLFFVINELSTWAPSWSFIIEALKTLKYAILFALCLLPLWVYFTSQTLGCILRWGGWFPIFVFFLLGLDLALPLWLGRRRKLSSSPLIDQYKTTTVRKESLSKEQFDKVSLPLQGEECSKKWRPHVNDEE